MHPRKRLEEASKNVSFKADRTWCNISDSYTEANLELHLSERRLEEEERRNLKRPRTVRDVIPESRLAQYVDCPYNESREVSYVPSDSSYTDMTNSVSSPPTEPWEMPEVEPLFKKYTQKPANRPSTPQVLLEPPHMKVNEFEGDILKFQIVDDRVKDIWMRTDLDGTCAPQTTKISFACCLTPLDNYILTYIDSNDDCGEAEGATNKFKTNDIEQLEELSKLLKQLNCKSKSEVRKKPEPMEHLSSEISYSKILQGVSSSNSRITPTPCRIAPEKTPSQNHDTVTNFTVVNSLTSNTKESGSQSRFYNVSQNSEYAVPQEVVPPLPEPPVNMLLENEPQHMVQVYPQTMPYNQYHVDAQTSCAMIPNTPLYVHQSQTYMYVPAVPTLPGWVQPTGIYYPPPPRHTPLSDWINPAMASIWGVTQSADEELVEAGGVEESVNLPNGLEGQAFEQYVSCNENVCQGEFEGQPTEEFTSCPGRD